jgi:hypothetical protein
MLKNIIKASHLSFRIQNKSKGKNMITMIGASAQYQQINSQKEHENNDGT